MVQKKRKSKINSVKRNNQLRTKLQKQGKLKTQRNRPKSRKKVNRGHIPTYSDKEEEIKNDDFDVLNMIEYDDLTFLKNAVTNKSYSFLKDVASQQSLKRKRKKFTNDESEVFESQYEQHYQNNEEIKKTKYLLPIKTSEGIVVRSEEILSEDEKENYSTKKKNNEVVTEKKFQPFEDTEEIRSIDLLVCRKKSLEQKKFRIGILCSGLTENPEEKIHNFKALLQMLDGTNPEVCITAQKLVLVSLLEVFKDLLPDYQIKHQNDQKVKLKKVVKQLHNYEKCLLKYYKDYLKKIEKIVLLLKRKKGDNRILKEAELKLTYVALQCLCDLIITHPYFNFSKNIIRLLVPFLNNGRENVRETVSQAIKSVFKTDKRGEVSLDVVRTINKYVKKKSNIVHCEILSVFLSLNLKEVDLNKEKEEELKKKREEAKKHKYMKLSKRERKRIKKFKSLQNELLETKAEENKKSKEHCFTEITKILFTIYFRILKEKTNSKLLNVVLEGLAKFAHCINIEFYQDLIIVLDNLIQNENLGYKEKFCCVQTVFTVLHYQGATINVDPVRFYTHFYANIFQLDAGKNHSDLPLVLKTADFVLLKRRKHLSLQRLLAFTKRLTALALQVLPNGALSLLSLVKQILQVNNSTDLLLDLESGHGQGIYYPEMEEPEYCNADASSLWELLQLRQHYHPTVREFADNIIKIGQKRDDVSYFKNFSKQSAYGQIFEQYDPTNVKFNPAIPPPQKFPKNKRAKYALINPELENYVAFVMKKLESKSF